MKKLIPLYFLFTLAVIFSCSKEEKGLEATATGFVKIYDEMGKEQFDRTGVQVRTTDGSASSTTNEMGKYLLTGLKLGKNYDLEISREGYGSLKYFDNLFLNGPKSNLIYTLSLYQQPTYKILNSEFYILNGALIFSADITNTKRYSLQMFLNDSSDLSNTHYDFKSYTSLGSSTYSGYNNVMTSFNISSTKYAPGTTVYALVYFYNFSDPTYYDFDLKQYIYSSAVKATDILTIKIP